MTSVGCRSFATFAALALVLVCLPRGVAAQAVRGTVTDAETEAPIAGARVTLRTAAGVTAGSARSNERGEFHLAARAAGDYHIEAARDGYAMMAPVPIRIDDDDLVQVSIRLSHQVMELEALTVTGRRRDPRHEASYDGALARHASFPIVGNRRVVVRDDPEMVHSSRLAEVMRWFPPARGCLEVIWNGNPATIDGYAYLDDTTNAYEAVEFYRHSIDVPLELRMLTREVNCSVLALWPRQAGEPRHAGRGLRRAAMFGAALLLIVVVR